MYQGQIAYRKILRHVNLDLIEYGRLMDCTISFIRSEILPMAKLAHVGKSRLNKINGYVDAASNFLRGNISVAELEKNQKQAWRDYDASEKYEDYRNLIRLLVCCLYEKDPESEMYGIEMLVELFVSCIEDVNASFCNKYANYVIKYFKKAD